MSDLLEIRGLSCGYGDRPVLDGVDLTVREGEAVLLAGPNGCGKSTLLKAIIGALPLTAGDVVFGGDVLLGVEDDGTVVGVKGDAVAIRNNIMIVANEGNSFDSVAYVAPEIVENEGDDSCPRPRSRERSSSCLQSEILTVRLTFYYSPTII